MTTPRIEARPRPAEVRSAEQAAAAREQMFGGPPPEGLTLAPIGPAPCSRACPVGINVKRYVGLVAEARFEEALAVVRRDNPLAAVCGFLCNRPCEVECARGAEPDESPIPIRALKQMAARVVADSGALPELFEHLDADGARGRVAVVGGGPSGLTAARDLRLLGYAVTLLESREELGGLLALEVPEARLPRWAVAADVAYVLAHGVQARMGVDVADGEAVRALLSEGFDAVLLAIGAPRELGCGLPGEGESEDVRPALELLRGLADGQVPSFKEAVVLGGTPTAFAAATALAETRRGGVTLVFGRERWALPVDPLTLAEAEDAGVRLRCLERADEIEVSDGMVTGVVLTRWEPTGRTRAGRSRMQSGASSLLEADFVVTAGEREPNLQGLEGAGLSRSPFGTLAVDPVTLETGMARVFGTGEAVAGVRTVIEAVALGRRAAVAVDRALGGQSAVEETSTVDGGLRLGPVQGDQDSAWRHTLEHENENVGGRVNVDARDERAGELEPVALAAARRCLRCGPCTDCATCSAYCPEEHLADPQGRLIRAPRRLTDAEIGQAERIHARVDALRCRACGLCEEHCPYSAPRIMARANGRLLSTVDTQSCRGCGVCVGLCPTGALSMAHYDNPYLAEAVDRLLLPSEAEL